MYVFNVKSYKECHKEKERNQESSYRIGKYTC